MVLHGAESVSSASTGSSTSTSTTELQLQLQLEELAFKVNVYVGRTPRVRANLTGIELLWDSILPCVFFASVHAGETA